MYALARGPQEQRFYWALFLELSRAGNRLSGTPNSLKGAAGTVKPRRQAWRGWKLHGEGLGDVGLFQAVGAMAFPPKGRVNGSPWRPERPRRNHIDVDGNRAYRLRRL